MKEIPLTQGKVALVSDEDYEYLSQFKWHAASCRGRFEARRKVMDGDKLRSIRMHNIILGAKSVDYVDGNALNNQRDNLRPCSRAQNGQNRKIQKHSSRFKGVSFWKLPGKYAASIRVFGKRIHLGYFDNEVDAAKKYDEAASVHFGQFARTNQQMGGYLAI